MFCNFNFKKKRNYGQHYATLIIVIIAVIVAILGIMVFKDALFPLLLSAIWAFLIKMIKKSVKSYFSQ